MSPAPLFEYLEEPISASSLVVGSTVGLVLSGMLAVALLALPLMHLVSGTMTALRQLLRWGSRSAFRPGREPRPLELEGLSPPLARLAQQTRTLAIELRRRSEEARSWPDDAAELGGVQLRWWSSIVGAGVDFSGLMATRAQVFEWLDSVAGLGGEDAQRLCGLGVDPARVRELLTRQCLSAEDVRALAGVVWGFDERLLGAANHGYRSSAAEGRCQGGQAWRDGAPADQDDHEDAPDVVVAAHRQHIRVIARRYSRSKPEQEDLEQDISLAVWQALPGFRGESSVATFVQRVARYCCYRHLRRRGRFVLQPHTEISALADERADTCPESWLASCDEQARVHRAVKSLPDSLGSALDLYLSGMSYAEIGERLGISEGNVSVRLVRARRRLRQQLVAA